MTYSILKSDISGKITCLLEHCQVVKSSGGYIDTNVNGFVYSVHKLLIIFSGMGVIKQF